MNRVAALRTRYGTRFGVGVVSDAKNGFFIFDPDGDLIGGPSERLRWIAENYPTWAERSVSTEGAHLVYLGTGITERRPAQQMRRLAPPQNPGEGIQRSHCKSV